VILFPINILAGQGHTLNHLFQKTLAYWELASCSGSGKYFELHSIFFFNLDHMSNG
jgi:hypothetical protein